MVYRKKGGKTYYTRIDRRLISCGTTLHTVADAMVEWVDNLKRRHDLLGVRAAIVSGAIGFAEAYKLDEKPAHALLEARRAAADDLDLAPLLDVWEDQRVKQKRPAKTTSEYLRQCRALYPERPWPRSTVTAPEIAKRLDKLPVSDSTKNRHRTGLSAFLTWCVRRGDLTTNAARLAGGYTENDVDIVFHSMKEAERIIKALPLEYRGREALMAGTGMDWTDTELVHVAEINLTSLTVRCHGRKTKWRNREIKITQPWTVPYIRAHLKGKHQDALAFSGSESMALRAHKAAVAACKLKLVSTLHQWRHTYAVAELQAGEYATVVAHQLGHKDASLVWARYGRYVPQARDYRAERAKHGEGNEARVVGSITRKKH